MAGVFGFAIWLFLIRDSNPEPTYAGKSLSEWVVQLSHAGMESDWRKAREAIRAIGTNAVPFLIEWMTYEPGTFRQRLITYVQRFPAPNASKETIRAWLLKPVIRRSQVQYVFQLLKEDAAPAIPGLQEVALDNRNRFQTQELAIFLLSRLARYDIKAIAALTNVAAATTSPALILRPDFIAQFRDPSPFTPILIERLKDETGNGAYASAATLGQLIPDPEEVIPALVEATGSNDPGHRQVAIEALGNYRDEASNALPRLQTLRDDADAGVRSAAAKAIEKIAGKPPE